MAHWHVGTCCDCEAQAAWTPQMRNALHVNVLLPQEHRSQAGRQANRQIPNGRSSCAAAKAAATTEL